MNIKLELAPNTLNTFIKEVKFQFLGYPYQLLKPTINWNGIYISSIVDIACTKLQTIGMRGSKTATKYLYVYITSPRFR